MKRSIRSRVCCTAEENRRIHVGDSVAPFAQWILYLMVALAFSPTESSGQVPGKGSGEEQKGPSGEAVATTKDPRSGVVPVYSGQVVDKNGAPVAGATVMIDAIAYMKSEMPADRITQTDPDGKFELHIRESFVHKDPAYTRTPYVWAYKSGYSVRCVSAIRQNDLKMVLPDEKPFEIRVTHPDIDRFEDLVVSPFYYFLPNGRYTADRSTGLSGPMPLSLKRELTQKVSEDGTVTLVGVTKPLLSVLEFVSPEIGQQISCPVDAIELRPCGSLDIMVDCRRDQFPELITVSIEVEHDWEPRLSTTAGARYKKSLDQDGTLHIDKTPIGVTKVRVSWPFDSEIVPIPPASISIETGRTTTCVIKTVPAVELFGQVVLSDTGSPLINGRLTFHTLPDSKIRRIATTDSEGWYRVRMPAGQVRAQLVAMPQSGTHQYPPSSTTFIPKGGKEFEAELITVDPREFVRGFLIDDNGKRIPNRDVVLFGSHVEFQMVADRSDDRGSFVLRMDRFMADQFRKELQRGKTERLKVIPHRAAKDTRPLRDFIDQLDSFPSYKVMSQHPLVLKLSSE